MRDQMTAVSELVTTESVSLNVTCKFCADDGCALNLTDHSGCPIACSSYQPNAATKFKNACVNKKYSISWVSAAVGFMILSEVIIRL